MEKLINKLNLTINNHKENLVVGFFFLFSFLDFAFSFVTNISLVPIYLGILFLFIWLSLFRKKEYQKFLLYFVIYLFFKIILMFFANNYSTLNVIISIFLLPFLLLWGKDCSLSNKKIGILAFFGYLIIVLACAIFSYSYDVTSYQIALLCLLPLTLHYFVNHPNWLLKIGVLISLIISFIYLKSIALLFLFIITFFYSVLQNIFKKKNYLGLPFLILFMVVVGFFILTNLSSILSYFNIESMRFYDFFDLKHSEIIFFNGQFASNSIFSVLVGFPFEASFSTDILTIWQVTGIFGLILYLYLMYKALKKIKLRGIYSVSFWFVVLFSFINGNILLSGYTCFWLFYLVMNFHASLLEKKKILIVSNMYPSRLAKHYGAFVKNMVVSLRDLGYKVSVSSMTKHRFFITKLFFYSFFYLKSFLYSFWGDYDYVIVHFISHSTLPVWLGLLFSPRVKLILNAHGNDLVADYAYEEKNILKTRFFLKKADKVIVSSHYFKDCLLRDYAYPSSQVIIYPAGGINLACFTDIDQNKAKEKLGLDVNMTYFGSVLRLEKDKGYDTLLEAIYLLKEEAFNKKTKWVIIGDGNERKEFWNLVKKYRLEDLIIQKDFVYQEELNLYYNAFDLFIFPTKRKSESLGLVGLEAMACKTFVIGCDLYGPSEYLVAKVNSLTYQNTKTGKELAKRILEYNSLTESQKKEIINNGYLTALTFQKDAVVSTLVDMFGE